MQNTIEIECPKEILIGLHLDAQQFANLVKEEAAISLFREGRLSSGMAVTVFSNTTPFIALASIGKLTLLPGQNRPTPE